MIGPRDMSMNALVPKKTIIIDERKVYDTSAAAGVPGAPCDVG